MVSRYCKTCDEVTERKPRPNRLGECKVCAKRYADANKDKNKAWREANKEHIREYKRNRQRQEGRNYRDNNAAKINAKNAARRAIMKCDDADKGLVEEIYIARTCAQMYTGQPVHVDHIIPVAKGGKHHEDNLQLLYAIDNIVKSDNLQGE